MAWIESHTVLIRHRKLRELARGLRLRPSHAMGHLHALWHAALEQQEDGDLSSWSDEFIAEQSDFPGDAPQYVRLLQDLRWLDGKIVHDWLDYAGLYLTRKYASSVSGRARLVEIWSNHGRVYGSEQNASSTQTVRKQSPLAPYQPNQPTDLPPAGAGGSSGNGRSGRGPPENGAADEFSEANRLAAESGLGANVGGKQRAELRDLIAVDGYETALTAVRYAMSEIHVGGQAAISYAVKKVASERASRDLRRGKRIEKLVKDE